MSGAADVEYSDIGNMSSSSSNSWEQFKRYVLTNEGGTKVNSAGQADANGLYYIVEDDWAGNPTVGHGLCLKSSDGYMHTDEFSAYGINTHTLVEQYNYAVSNGYDSKNPEHYKYFPKVEVEICDAIWESHLQNRYNTIADNYGSLNLKEYQYYALVDVQYRRGNINGFIDAYNSKWNNSDDEYGQDVSGESFSEESLFSFFWDGGHSLPGVETRKKNQWLLFKYGFYTPLNEYWLSSYNGGSFTAGQGDLVLGTFTSNITGKTFTLINQNAYLDGEVIFSSECNRASGVILLSGYSSESIEDLIRKGQNNGQGFPYNNSNLYTDTALEVSNQSSQINDYQAYIMSQLKQGNYILMRFNNQTYGKSGAQWASDAGHWITILGYKKEDGIDKIFTGDPGYKNNGWYSIDEFEASPIQYIYLVKPKNN